MWTDLAVLGVSPKNLVELGHCRFFAQGTTWQVHSVQPTRVSMPESNVLFILCLRQAGMPL